MAFYEQKVGLSLEFSMTSFLSRVAAFGERDGVGLDETKRLDWSFTREGVIQRFPPSHTHTHTHTHAYRSSFPKL